MIADNVPAGYDDEGNITTAPPRPFRCECGKFYETTKGVDMCVDNRHGNGKDAYKDRYQFSNTSETTYIHYCAACSERIASKMHEQNGVIEFIMLPHICPVDEPED